MPLQIRAVRAAVDRVCTSCRVQVTRVTEIGVVLATRSWSNLATRDSSQWTRSYGSPYLGPPKSVSCGHDTGQFSSRSFGRRPL